MINNMITFSRAYFILIIIMGLMTLPVEVCGVNKKTPQWLEKGETYLNNQRANNTYYFKIIQNTGSDIASLRQSNANALADYIGKRNKVQGLEVIEINNTQTHGGDVSTSENYQMVFKNSFSTESFYAILIDQYWESEESTNGSYYQYYALYAVSTSGNGQPVFDHFEVTRSYGAVPAVMSIIPGVGQLYKGQKVKGFLMMGTAVLSAAAIVYTSNRRSYYETRIEEQPKFARDYSQKRDNYTTWRNVAIGATGALVVWSVLDAALTPGATRIKVSPSSYMNIRPSAMTDSYGTGIGLSLALIF